MLIETVGRTGSNAFVLQAKCFMRFKTTIFALGLLSLSVSACGSEIKGPPDEDFVNYDLRFEISDDASVPREKKMLHIKLQRAEAVSFTKLTNLFLLDQVQLYNRSQKSRAKKDWSGDKSLMDITDLEILLSDIAQDLQAVNYHAMKEEYEGRIAKDNPILFDSTAESLPDYVVNARMQSYSGTALQQVIARRVLGAEKFRAANWVIIFEEGHLLPGYMQKTGDDWRLTGIETTTEGPSRVEYGLVSQLDLAVRILDAELFMLLELYKGFLVNPEEAQTDALRWTAKRYDIPLNQTEVLAKAVESRSTSEEDSPCAFGKQATPKGPVRRNHLDFALAGEARGINGLGEFYQSRILVDRRYEEKTACELKGPVKIEQLPAWTRGPVSKFLSQRSELETNQEFSLFVDNCLLYIVVYSNTEDSIGDFSAWWMDSNDFESSNVEMQIIDLTAEEVLLSPSRIGLYSVTTHGDDQAFMVFTTLSEGSGLKILSTKDRAFVETKYLTPDELSTLKVNSIEWNGLFLELTVTNGDEEQASKIRVLDLTEAF